MSFLGLFYEVWLYMKNQELQYYLNRKDVLIVDLRTSDDYMSGHLPGAVNIPFERLSKRTGLLENGSFHTVIFYCERGNLSLRMARFFAERGYRALSLNGGMASYHGKLV